MMGPIAGAADGISQLKGLLELVSDPKKVGKAIEELESVQAETKKLLDAKSKVETDVDAKLKKLADEKLAVEELQASANALDAEVHVKQAVYLSNLNDLEARENQLLSVKKEVEKERAGQAAKLEQIKAQAEAQNALHAEKLAEANAIKEEYEAKLAKLKQAMG